MLIVWISQCLWYHVHSLSVPGICNNRTKTPAISSHTFSPAIISFIPTSTVSFPLLQGKQFLVHSYYLQCQLAKIKFLDRSCPKLLLIESFFVALNPTDIGKVKLKIPCVPENTIPYLTFNQSLPSLTRSKDIPPNYWPSPCSFCPHFHSSLFFHPDSFSWKLHPTFSSVLYKFIFSFFGDALHVVS